MTPTYNKEALDLANKINDIYAKGWEGGVAQRTSSIQIACREALIKVHNGVCSTDLEIEP